MVASSVWLREGLACIGSDDSTISFQVGKALSGLKGKLMQDTSSGTPAAIAGQSSSLPTKRYFDSLCSRIWRTLSAVSVG